VDKNNKINVRLDSSLIEKINTILVIEKTSMSDFIRKCIENELERSNDNAREFRRLNDKVSKIDADSIHQNLGDLNLNMEAVFEELRRQNEVLKLIHRRSMFGANFSQHVLEKVGDDGLLNNLINQMEVVINNEMKQLKF
jgi:Arc/MetJ-type ribon-helix-helix transcriptional regulator